MRKIFNYRPIVSICLFLMAGIIFVVGIYSCSTAQIIFSSVMALLLVLTISLKLALAKEHKVFKIVSIISAFFVGAMATFITFEVFYARPKLEGEFVITGTVSERAYENKNESIVLTLRNISALDNENRLRYELDGCVRLYLSVGDGRCMDFELGDRVSAISTLYRPSLFKNGSPDFYNLTKNILAIGNGNEDDVFCLSKSPTIFDSFKNKVKDVLDLNLDADYSELGYTMLFGDRGGLDDAMQESYYASGIGHVLAVSGLHVGFVVLLLSGILSLFKANNKVKFAVISAAVFIYAFLCGFTTSITRALIMTVVLLFSKMRYREYDGLSSLSLAALLILLFSPLQLFTLGFQLSFGAVLSIILLSRPLEAFFGRFFHKRVSSALAISISATLGTLPFSAYSLNSLSLFSVITNVIAIPIVTVAFMILAPSVIASLIFSFMGILTKGFEFLMRIVTGISQLTGAVSLAGANKYLLFAFGVFLIALVIFSSDTVFQNKKSKAITCTLSATLSAASLIVSLVL